MPCCVLQNMSWSHGCTLSVAFWMKRMSPRVRNFFSRSKMLCSRIPNRLVSRTCLIKPKPNQLWCYIVLVQLRMHQKIVKRFYEGLPPTPLNTGESRNLFNHVMLNIWHVLGLSFGSKSRLWLPNCLRFLTWIDPTISNLSFVKQ